MQFAMPDATVVSARLLGAGAPCKTPPAYVFQPTPGADANHKRFTLAYLTLAIVMPCPDATGAAMTNAVDALSTQATQLPPAERLEVVERILDSLDQPDTALDTLWANEANDRLTAYRRGEIKAMALSDVIAKYQVAARHA